jgi:hypothetical protein
MKQFLKLTAAPGRDGAGGNAPGDGYQTRGIRRYRTLLWYST